MMETHSDNGTETKMKRIAFFPLCAVLLSSSTCLAQDDIADVRSTKRQVGSEKRQAYFLIPPSAKKVPPDGFGLLVILPGGAGGESFHPFVKRIRKNAVPDDFVVAQPIAFKWSSDQRVVWPTEKLTVAKQKFSSEEFVEAVIKDIAATHSIDSQRVYCMGWSSSGPAIYSLALRDKTAVKGSYVLMSVYKPEQLPPIKRAKGRSIYIEHSPDDRVCPYWMAKKGYEALRKEGARTTLATYEGGHGWRGNLYGRIRKALDWLDEDLENKKD